MKVYVSETAFLSIVVSSIEAYKKECYGLILGYRTDTQWRIEYALPYQTAERGHKAVTPHGIRDRRVKTCLAQVSSYEQLGTYHSHPAWGNLRALAKPSSCDVKTMLSGDLELIVAVNDAKCPRRFRYGDGGRVLSGTVSNFALNLAAFYKPPLGETTVRRIPMRCPYAIGIEQDTNLK